MIEIFPKIGNNSLQFLSRITYYSRYARSDLNCLTFKDSCKRLIEIHNRERNFTDVMDKLFGITKMEILRYMTYGLVVPSMRSIQFLDAFLDRNERMYNCAGIIMDKLENFWKVHYLLLCGCGVGYNILFKHVEKLPAMLDRIDREKRGVKRYVVDDSIWGWAMASYALIRSFFPSFFGGEFSGYHLEFDYSKITPKGVILRSCGRGAPGYEPLAKGLETLRNYLLHIRGNRLKPIHVHDIICIIASTVVSGGVRRSALISCFDFNDVEMRECKTGDWYKTYPWRAYANNSMIVTPEIMKNLDTKRLYTEVINNAIEYGEPGVLHLQSTNHVCNPCAEVVFDPWSGDVNSYQFCNLTEVCVPMCEFVSKEIAGSSFSKILETAVKIAAGLGAVQATYTNFACPIAKMITEKDYLLGVSLTGLFHYMKGYHYSRCDLKKLANVAKNVSYEVLKYYGKHGSSRVTCIKPSGTVSCLLGCSSGIHPWYDRRYIRHINVTNDKNTRNIYEMIFGDQYIHKSDLYNSEIISVPVDVQDYVRGDSVCVDIDPIKMLGIVEKAHSDWILTGANILNNAVSFTLHFSEGDKEKIVDYLSEKAKDYIDGKGFPFSGISFFCRDNYNFDSNIVPMCSIKNEELEKEFSDLVTLSARFTNNDIDKIFLKHYNASELVSVNEVQNYCDNDACLLRKPL